MKTGELLNEILGLYRKHGWQPRRLILTAETLASLQPFSAPADFVIQEGELDGLWFSRTSHGGREAWELRQLAEQPYALFETFEADETEEEREERRNEIAAQMRNRISGTES